MSVIFRQLFGFGVISGLAYWFWRYFAPQHSILVLEDKAVVITGAASRLGRALALSFAKRGARVALVGDHIETLETVQREIEPYASAVLIIEANVANTDQQTIIQQKAIDAFGQIDVLVNNSEGDGNNLLVNSEPDRVREIIEINLTATMLFTQETLPIMLAQQEGYILFTGSDIAHKDRLAFSAHMASQHGIAGFADSLRRELTGSNIHITLATPNRLHGETAYTEEVNQVADAIVDGLVQGQYKVVFGGIWGQLGIILEQFWPRLSDWYWKQIKSAI